MELRDGYKNTKIGVIPVEWEVKTLKDVGEVKMCKRIFNVQTKEQGDIPFYKIGTFGKEADAFISKELYKEFRKKYSFPKVGDILISAAGTIGRTLIYKGEDGYFQDSNIVWIENNDKVVSNNYLNFIYEVVNYRTEGGTIRRLYNNIIYATPIICPPLPEQTAIATVLSDTDNLLQALQKKIAKKQAIKKGAMQMLLKPKEGWKIKTLGEIANFRRGSFPQPYGLDQWYDENNGMPFVQVFDVDKNMKLKTTTKQKISDLAKDKSVFVKKGNIVLTIQGSIGRIAVTQYDAYVDRTLLIFTDYKVPMDILFFSYIVQDKFRIEKENAPGGIIKTITKEALSKFEMIFPPTKEEQTEIATILSDMNNDIENLEKQLAKYKQVKQGLMQNLLTGKIRLV